MKRISAITCLLAMTSLTVACGGVMTSDHPTRQIYLLEPYSVQSDENTGDPWPALALAVTAVPGLDTDHIQALSTDASLKHYANARWADFLPEVLSSVLRRSLASTGRFEAVKATVAPDSGDWTLALEVQQFFGNQDASGNTSSVEARFEGLLHCNDEDHQLQMSVSRTVREERLSVVVRAHQQALDGITQQLVDQIMESCH